MRLKILTATLILTLTLAIILSPAAATPQEYYAETIRLQAVRGEIYAELDFEGDRFRMLETLTPQDFSALTYISLWAVSKPPPQSLFWTDLPNLPKGVTLLVEVSPEAEEEAVNSQISLLLERIEQLFPVRFYEMSGLWLAGLGERNLKAYYSPTRFQDFLEAYEDHIPSEYGGFAKLVNPNLYREAGFAMIGLEFEGGTSTVKLRMVHLAEASEEGLNSFKASVKECFNYPSYIEASPSSASSEVEVKIYCGAISKALIPNLTVEAGGSLKGSFEGVENYPDIYVVYALSMAGQPYLQATKVIDRAKWLEGDQVKVTIYLTNLGEGAALNVKLDDSEAYEALSTYAAVSEGEYTVSFARIDPGQTVEASYILNVEAITEGEILEIPPAKVTYTDETLLNLYTAESNSVVAGLGVQTASLIPILEVTSITAEGGQTVKAELTLANIGNSTASTVSILAKTEGGWVSKEVGDIPPASTATVDFSAEIYGVNPVFDLGKNTTITFFSEETSGGSISPLKVEANSAPIYALSQNLPRLEISKQVDRQLAAIDETFQVKVSLKAVGKLPAGEVDLYEVLPEGLEYVGGDFNPVSGLTRMLKSSVALENLEEPISLTYKVAVRQPEIFVQLPTMAIAKVSETGSTLTFYAENTPVTSATLSLAKEAELAPEEGVISVTVTVTNEGSLPIRSLKVADSLPEGYNLASGETQGEIEALGPGDSYTLTYKIAVARFESVELPPASASYSFLHLKFTQTSNPVKLTIPPPSLTVKKTLLAERALQSEPLKIQVEVKNEGAAPIYNLKIVDSLPEGFNLKEGNLTLKVEALEPGGKAAFSYVAEPSIDGVYTLPKALVEYTFYGQTFKAESNPVENVVVAPKLLVEKTIEPAELKLGEKAKITLLVKNVGKNLEALNVTVTDLAPPYLEVVEGSTSGFTAILPPGQTYTLTYTVKFKEAGNFSLPNPTVTYKYAGGQTASTLPAEQVIVTVKPREDIFNLLQSPMGMAAIAVVAAGAASAAMVLKRRRARLLEEEELEDSA
ncbi:MAG: COG1361 family protein [Candidatus Hecatellaceae archaeon]